MSYQVFARKYRPQTFADVLGQDHVVRTLSNAIAQNRLAHAYLFVGPRGTGKTSTARIFAKALNCPGGPNIDFDPNDPVCQEIARGESLDVLEIDGASNNGVDQVRDLRETVKYAPTNGRFKIYYIDEVHMLSTAAFNALLKTLEEPPPHVKFIFATTEANKILPTIISRCQRFDLRRISDPVIANHLLHIAELEKIDLEEKAAFAIAKGADGGMRDAQSMLDQLVAFCGHKIVETDVLDMFGFTPQEAVSGLSHNIIARDTVGALRFVHDQTEAGKDLGRLLSDLIQHFRTLLVFQTDPEAAVENLSPEMAQAVAEQSRGASIDQLLRIVDGLAELDARMRWASNKRLHFELGVIQAVESMAEVSLSDVIEAIDKAGGSAGEAAHAVQTRRSAAPIVPLQPRPRVVAEPRHVNPPTAPKRDDDPSPLAFDDEPEAPTASSVPPWEEPVAAPAPAPKPVAVAAPAPAPAPRPAPVMENIVAEPPPALEPACDLDNLWLAMLPQVKKKRPLISAWVQVGTQLSYNKGVLKVGFPTSEAHSCESLKREATRTFLQDVASELAAERVKLDLIVDSTLTLPPVQEFFLGLDSAESAPPPAPVPVIDLRAAAPAAPPETAPAPEAEAPAAPDPNAAFYEDDLIKAALRDLQGRIVAPT